MQEKEDHGSDLLELSTQVPADQKTEGSHSAPDVAPDITDDVRILIQEGLLDEAKKRIRQSLVQNPDWIQGRVFLEEIHDRELEDLLKRPELAALGTQKPETVSVMRIMRELDRDLQLSMDLWTGASSAAQETFSATLLNSLVDTPASVALDLGIACFEMGLLETSLQLFGRARATALSTSEPDPTLANCAQLLSAQTLIECRRENQAIPDLLVLWAKGELSSQEQAVCAYLLGQAFETQGNLVEAHRWLQEAARLDSDFRDVRERLNKLQGVH